AFAACQTSAGICESPSLFDFSLFDHATVVLELLLGESCSRLAAFTDRKEALRLEFGDGLSIAQRVKEPGGKLRRDILGRMRGRGRDKPDVCLKILQADFGKRRDIRHRGDTRGGSDRQGGKLVAAYQLSDVGIARHHGRDVPAKRGAHRWRRSLVWNEVHSEVHYALHRLDGDMRAGRWTGARNGQLTGRLLSSFEKIR